MLQNPFAAALAHGAGERRIAQQAQYRLRERGLVPRDTNARTALGNHQPLLRVIVRNDRFAHRHVLDQFRRRRGSQHRRRIERRRADIRLLHVFQRCRLGQLTHKND